MLASLRTLIGDIPVISVRGLNKGCWWTAYPFSSYWRGTHELDMQQAVRRHLPATGGVFWDLGAHFGFYTVSLARHLGPSGQVAAFDPNPSAFAKLNRHVTLNGLSNVRLFQVAVSDETSRRLLVQDGPALSTTAHLPYPGEVVAEGESAWVASARLDDLIAAGKIRDPDLVKVDVEGHAAEALQGASEALTRARPTLIIAFHSLGEISGVAETLRPLGYAPESMAGTPLDWAQLTEGVDFAFVLPANTSRS
jgi:FkbM family methyltransferase